MRSLLLGTLLISFTAAAEAPPPKIWTDLTAKRAKIMGVRQEFDVTRTFKVPGHDQSSKQQIQLDMSQGRWRERSIAGYGNHIRIFDGAGFFYMEEGGDEYLRPKHKGKDEDPMPSPYEIDEPNWSKAQENGRAPCGLTGTDHQCVILVVPLKPSIQSVTTNNPLKILEGVTQLSLDIETGLLIASRTIKLFDNGRGTYQSDTSYMLKRQSYSPAAPGPALFELPAGLREVKEFSQWNASKIKKQLAGNPAPELSLTDIKGKPLTLASLKGKTVLLDFFTTWCPPCRADAPAIEKLYAKYGAKELAIIGISVSEERQIVETFLNQHPHPYPTVLTSENEMPRPYQIGIYPTYIVIDSDGNVASAVEGNKGFDELRKILRKAGLETE